MICNCSVVGQQGGGGGGGGGGGCDSHKVSVFTTDFAFFPFAYGIQ